MYLKHHKNEKLTRLFKRTSSLSSSGAKNTGYYFESRSTIKKNGREREKLKKTANRTFEASANRENSEKKIMKQIK